jgi:hypothetical protein
VLANVLARMSAAFVIYVMTLHGAASAQVALPDAPSATSSITSASESPRRHEARDATPRLSAPCEGKISMVVQTSDAGPQADSGSHYVPLSKHCKFEAFWRQTYSPFTFISAAWEATWDQAWAQWPQYGGGMQGWSKRLGATLADTESRRFIQGFVLASALHQDPRYFPSNNKKLLPRMAYAVTRVVVTRGDGGNSDVNGSELLGALFTSSLQNAYYPRPDRGFSNTLNRFGGALSSDAITDLLHEFSPDMKHIFHKHAPKKVLELEQKLPIPPEDKP